MTEITVTPLGYNERVLCLNNINENVSRNKGKWNFKVQGRSNAQMYTVNWAIK